MDGVNPAAWLARAPAKTEQSQDLSSNLSVVLQDLHSEETVRTFILKAEQIQADIPLEGWMALPIMPSWRMDLGQLYPVTATVY